MTASLVPSDSTSKPRLPASPLAPPFSAGLPGRLLRTSRRGPPQRPTEIRARPTRPTLCLHVTSATCSVEKETLPPQGLAPLPRPRRPAPETNDEAVRETALPRPFGARLPPTARPFRVGRVVAPVAT